MAYTNGQLVRLLLGDSGVPARDVTDGDGASKEFYVSTPPVLPSSAAVFVAGALQTETTHYTLDDTTGRLVFTSAPPSAIGNVVVIYFAVQFTDADVTEACRQEGLDASLGAASGEPLPAYRAAIMLALGKAAELATVDAGASSAWRSLATDLKARASSLPGGLQAGSTARVDGYSQDRKATDVGITGTNPRRVYYGAEDRLP